MGLSALFHNESVPVHSWTKSVIDQIPNHGDAIETACIRMHFQTTKYPVPILNITLLPTLPYFSAVRMDSLVILFS